MVGVVDVDVRAFNYLKDELAWTVDKRLQVISTILKNSKCNKELKGTKE